VEIDMKLHFFFLLGELFRASSIHFPGCVLCEWTGEFVNNQYEGEGKLTFVGGSWTQGRFSAGKQNGPGEYHFASFYFFSCCFVAFLCFEHECELQQ
jgi:hypothetical protein